MIIIKAHIQLKEQISESSVSALVKKHNLRKNDSARFFLTGMKPGKLTLCQVSEPDADSKTSLREFLTRNGVSFGEIEEHQIGVIQFAEQLHQGNHVDLCPAPQNVLMKLHMMPYICDSFDKGLVEAVIASVSDSTVKKHCKELRCASLREELERIQASAGQPFHGHPVLYSVVTEMKTVSEDILDALLPALHNAGRLPGKRLAVLKPCKHPLPEFVYDDVYLSQGGAAVLVELGKSEKNQETEEALATIARLAREYRSEVLTVFRTCAKDSEGLMLLRKITDGLPILPICEDRLAPTEAKKYLSAKAKDAGLGRVSFTKELPADKSNFSRQELDAVFDRWQDCYLCTKAYPQYAEFMQNSKPAVPSHRSLSAMEELRQLIGLENVKQIISQAVDYVHMQNLCRERGIPAEAPHLHMVFTGNPGTAKTTVARLVARIFRECGVLSKGDLVEVGRGDLIGKYVGWTANLVKEKFRQAEGSVLFIDEAYSLLDDKENQFGDEAINAIVQEMENHRDSTVVIFAGYSEPMERFLKRNPGLSSRVSYNIHFPDYGEEELMDIVRLIMKSKYRTLTPDAEATVRTLLRDGMENPDFGNGRYARKIVEQAMMHQASRLAALPPSEVDDEMLLCLAAEDFVREETEAQKPCARVIGFCA